MKRVSATLSKVTAIIKCPHATTESCKALEIPKTNIHERPASLQACLNHQVSSNYFCSPVKFGSVSTRVQVVPFSLFSPTYRRVSFYPTNKHQNARLVRNTFRTPVKHNIVEERSHHHAKNWTKDRAPEPVLVSEVEDCATIPYHSGKDTGTQVTSRIKGCSSIHAESRTDTKNCKKYSNRNNARRRRSIFFIREHKNSGDEHGRPNKLHRVVSMYSIED